EAVAIGMVIESSLACPSQPILTSEVRTRVAEQIKKAVVNAGLPTKIKMINLEEILKIILADKKNINREILMSLPRRIGKVIPNIKISSEKIRSAIDHYN
ncbi:MAG: hypothetical protein NUV87_03675, partial [Candidatus Roizmanbacteria bacterium]|nr:hypothetical protein [Candidatus Roizmanbacteria bacterium]MCR4312841.1 hypothetical protein [Candidatus Roizmanbacteria bacterium]